MKNKDNKSISSNENNQDNIYKVSFLGRIPYVIKALFIKYWFFGAAYFFINMGLGNYVESSWALTIINGLFLGICYDFMIFPIFKIMDTYKEESQDYILFRNRKFYSIIINIAYGVVLSVITFTICSCFTLLIGKVQEGTWWFREPLSYALVNLIVDTVLLTIKYGVKCLIKKIFNKETL